ncbi:MAG: hypothetical protein ACRD9R_08085 [Pyrinomonadaceae bacterium]
MRLKRLLAPAAIILVCATQLAAQQTPCALTQAPEFRGFRLGMTPSEARESLDDPTLFDAKLSPGSNAESTAVRLSGAELKPETGEGIDDVNLSFVDGRLSFVRVSHHADALWSNSREFVERVSESLGLPKPGNSPAAGNGGNDKYQINCNGFAVTLAYLYGVSPTVTMVDTAAQKVVDKRKEKQVETRKKTISPFPDSRPRPLP